MYTNFIHTTEIIKNLNYKTLVNDGLLPRVTPLKHKDYTLAELPSFVKKSKCYMFFGMFMEHAFRAFCEEIQSPTEVDLDHVFVNVFDNLKQHYNKASKCTLSYDDSELVYSILDDFYDTYDSIYKYEDCLYDQQLLTNFDLMAQPDIVSVDPETKELIVFEMKNSTYFPRMQENALLQTFTYCALYQTMGYKVTDAYILLPMYNDYLHVSVSGFDFSGYCSVLIGEVLNRLMPMIDSCHYNSVYDDRMYGLHMAKQRTVYKTLIKYMSAVTPSNVDTYGLQMYIGNKYNGRGTITDNDKKQTKALIQEHGLNVFSHGALTVNFANPTTNFSIAIKEMCASVDLGFSGMVVHCGKNVPESCLSYDDALNLMEDMLWELMEYATESCPVILETCAGQGNELCFEFEEFIWFYQRFDDDPRLAICVDTCHVFAAGYCPLKFIEEVLDQEPEGLVLVHLNGSKYAQGEKKDRHSKLHEGYIDFDVIEDIIKLCVERKIPMVRE